MQVDALSGLCLPWLRQIERLEKYWPGYWPEQLLPALIIDPGIFTIYPVI